MNARTFGAAAAIRVCVIALMLAGLSSACAASDKAITSVDVANQADRVVITVGANCALSVTPLVGSRGNYVGFQFPVKLAAKGRLVGIHNGRIYNVRFSNFRSNPPLTRIVVNTSAHVDYSTEWGEGKKRLIITVWKHGAKKRPETAEPAAAPARSPQSGPPVSKSFQPMPVQPAKTVTQPAPKPEPEAEATVQAKVEVKGYAEANPEPAPPATEPVAADPAPATTAAIASAPAATDEPAAAQPAAVGSGPAPVHTPRTVEARATMARLTPLAAEPVRAERTVSLNFLGADIQDVLKALSVQSGENIVASKDVTGNVTVSLSDVTVEKALDYVARLSGYGYTREGDTYLVGSTDSLRSLVSAEPDEPKVEVVALNYAGVDDTMNVLKAQFPDLKVTRSGGDKSDKGSKAGTAGGVIVLSGTEKTLSDAKQLVAQVDDSMRSLVGGVKTEIYRLRYASATEMVSALSALVPNVSIALAPSDGFDLTAPESVKLDRGDSGGGSTVSHSETRKRADDIGRVRALVIEGSEAAVDKAMALAAKLDIRPPQIKIDAKVTSLTESGEKKLGLSWDWGPFAKFESYTRPDEDDLTTNVNRATKQWIRQPWNFAATLDALIKEGEGQLLAAPSMMCMEGKPGIFFVGDEVRYIVLVQQTTTGQNIITETANVGVQLRVAGEVTPEGEITLNIHPEVSVLQLEKDQATGITLPIITRRFTDHVVRMKSGETIVIGGLIRDEELEILSKVPILGDLPVLGKLFRHKSTTRNHSEVVMFITATILDE